MKLCLIRESNRAGNMKRKRELVHKFSRKAQCFQGIQFPLNLTPVVQRIGVGHLFLKVAVNMSAQFPVCLKRCLVGGKILPCLPDSKLGKQLFIDQPVLAQLNDYYRTLGIYENELIHPDLSTPSDSVQIPE